MWRGVDLGRRDGRRCDGIVRVRSWLVRGVLGFLDGGVRVSIDGTRSQN